LSGAHEKGGVAQVEAGGGMSLGLAGVTSLIVEKEERTRHPMPLDPVSEASYVTTFYCETDNRAYRVNPSIGWRDELFPDEPKNVLSRSEPISSLGKDGGL
jgi:hypothetical protein